MTSPSHATREQVVAALDMEPSTRLDPQVDQVLAAATGRVDDLCHRRFSPVFGTRTFDRPSEQPSRWHRLWLDADELVDVVELRVDGVVVDSADYLLRPDSGPPYSRVELSLDGSATFTGSSTWQRAVSITGLWGHRDDEVSAGSLASSVTDSATSVTVTDGSAVGVGDLVRVDAERMVVVGRRMVSTGQTLLTPIGAGRSEESLSVTSGAAFSSGETLLLDAERMTVDDVVGDVLIVVRAQGGSTLAAHTGSTIHTPRILDVERGAGGTTASAHLVAAPLYRHVVPPMVRELTIGLALDSLQQRSSAYARTVGSGEGARPASGRGLDELCRRVYDAHGRKVRTRVA